MRSGVVDEQDTAREFSLKGSSGKSGSSVLSQTRSVSVRALRLAT